MADTIGNAGEFSLELVEIITADGAFLDITANVVEIDIYEDIEVSCIHGSIAFADPVNFMNTLPVIGQEYVKIRVKTPSFKTSVEVIEHLFYMYTIRSQGELNSNSQIVVMDFCSVERIVDGRKRVNRTLKGTYANIVEGLVRGDLESKKDIYIEPSTNLKQILAPDISPLEIIKNAKREAIGAEFGAPTYQFYETTQGFHFRTLESLYNQKSVQYYSSSPQAGLEQRRKGTPNVLMDYQKIREWTIDNTRDTLSFSENGLWSSETIEHDIFNKMYTTTNYNYFDSFPVEMKIDDFDEESPQSQPMFSEGAVDDSQNRVSDYVKKSYLLPVSLKDRANGIDSYYTNAQGKYPYSGYNPSKWIGRRTSTVEAMGTGLSISITVDGYTAIHAGDIVTLELPSSSQNKSDTNQTVDRWFRGNFIIRNMKHSFNVAEQRHIILMQCVKDSTIEKPEGERTNPSPQPKEYGLSNQLAPKTYNKRSDFYS
jgi:hypothetical protein